MGRQLLFVAGDGPGAEECPGTWLLFSVSGDVPAVSYSSSPKNPESGLMVEELSVGCGC